MIRRPPLPNGPSPRAWGLRIAIAVIFFPFRSIPTCVGTTGIGVVPLKPHRSIPTCVGTTVQGRNAVVEGTVHPHVRGDYSWPPRGSPWVGGPSPRAWGLQDGGNHHSGHRRSIPTCVGTTCVLRFLDQGPTVHPHVRGDYCDCRGIRHSPSGPSPRAWGLQLPLHFLLRYQRSIPTCVGTTDRAPKPHRVASVHPHVRGDYSADLEEDLVVSVHPHVRGDYLRFGPHA